MDIDRPSFPGSGSLLQSASQILRADASPSAAAAAYSQQAPGASSSSSQRLSPSRPHSPATQRSQQQRRRVISPPYARTGDEKLDRLLSAAYGRGEARGGSSSRRSATAAAADKGPQQQQARGMPAGNVLEIIGPTAAGKTTLAGQIAVRWALDTALLDEEIEGSAGAVLAEPEPVVLVIGEQPALSRLLTSAKYTHGKLMLLAQPQIPTAP